MLCSCPISDIVSGIILVYLCKFSIFLILGAIVQGPTDVIYFPNQGPIQLTCVISQGSTGWRVNGRLYTLNDIQNGSLPGHSRNGSNIVVITPTNNTQYNCVSIRDQGDISSSPAFLYIAGK